METSSAYRFDFAPITGSETTDEGYLRVWCRAARTGTQLYRRADGSQVREYRPPDEVGSPDSLSTFGMKPATWGHPPVLLDAANTKQYQIGYSGSQVRYNDGFVEVALVVTDQDAIEKIKRKDATEVSAGYKVDFDPTPGLTPEGEEYAGVQRNIRVNHIAIVPRGRAGPEVRLLLDRMDAADAISSDWELVRESGPALQSISPAYPVMATVKLDGLEIDLPAEAATAVQSFARDMERQFKAVSTERDHRIGGEHARASLPRRHRSRLGLGQPQRIDARQFALSRRLVHLGCEHARRHDAGLRQQSQASRARAREHQRPLGMRRGRGHGRSST